MTTNATNSRLYRAHGLNISSDIALLEFSVASSTHIDVTIRFGHVLASPTSTTPAGTRFVIELHQTCLFYDEVAAFAVSGGREIVIDPHPSVDHEVLRLFLQGPVLAVLLHQRGRLVLHACAIAIGRGAALFLGSSGAGKSSMAAALYARGHEVLADDIVAMDVEHRTQVFNGCAQLKLWPDSAAAVAPDSSAGLPLRDGVAKRRWSCASGTAHAVPVNRIHVLETASEWSATKMPPVEAFTALVRHSYMAPLFAESGFDRRHFMQCASVASSGVVWRLQYPRVLAELTHVAEFVETSQGLP